MTIGFNLFECKVALEVEKELLSAVVAEEALITQAARRSKMSEE